MIPPAAAGSSSVTRPRPPGVALRPPHSQHPRTSAYRRPFTETDLKPLLAFYATGRKEKDFNNGIEMALRAMLVAPDFLFRIERDPGAAPPVPCIA